MTAPAGERAPLRKARTRAAIIAAAGTLFAEQGYDATSITQIASRADTGVGTLYNYFASKEDILRQVLAKQFEGAEAAFERLSEVRSDPFERLVLALDMYGTYVRQNATLLRSLMGITLRGDAEVDTVLRCGLRAAFTRLLDDAAAAGATRPSPSEPLARLLLSTYTCALLRVGAWQDVGGDDAAVMCTLRQIVDSLLRPAPAAN